MSEFCFSSTTNTHFYSLLLSDFIYFCSFMLTHPLYFSYFIFFSPYLLKLLSFLSPLFFTTFLLLLALLTVSPSFNVDATSPETSESKVGFLLSTYYSVLHTLRSRLDDDAVEFHLFKELEACVVLVFDTTSFKVAENLVEVSETKHEGDRLQEVLKCFGNQCFGLDVTEVLTQNVEDPVEVTQKKREGNSLESFSQENGVSASALTYKEGETQVEPTGAEINKVGETQDETLMGTGSEAPTSKISNVKVNSGNGGDYTSEMTENPKLLGKDLESFGSIKKEKEEKVMDNGGEYTSKVSENPAVLQATNLRSFGSMRKESDWKRTGDGENTTKAVDKPDILGSNLGRFGSMRKEKEWTRLANGGESEYTSKVVENSETLGSNLGSFGSMRKEKEWKRTLACKLFEERQNVGEGEGERMDLLWESYEADSGKLKMKNKEKKEKRSEVEDEEEDEDDMDGKLCCLQALKFSTRKMNLGMGRPNLVRISKALKGIGWFHHASRHNRKV